MGIYIYTPCRKLYLLIEIQSCHFRWQRTCWIQRWQQTHQLRRQQPDCSSFSFFWGGEGGCFQQHDVHTCVWVLILYVYFGVYHVHNFWERERERSWNHEESRDTIMDSIMLAFWSNVLWMVSVAVGHLISRLSGGKLEATCWSGQAECNGLPWVGLYQFPSKISKG